MNKEEILDAINKTKEYLANMEKMLEECEYERWKPNKGDTYYFVDGDLEVIADWWSTNDRYSDIYNAYNYFQTREQAEQESEKILVRRMLEDIARRLNKGKKIDWKDKNQRKYYFILDNWNEEFITDYSYCTIIPSVYCLDKNFKDVAIQEIGEERLNKYLRGE